MARVKVKPLPHESWFLSGSDVATGSICRCIELPAAQLYKGGGTYTLSFDAQPTRGMSIHELPAAVFAELEPNLYLKTFLHKRIRADQSRCDTFRSTRITRGLSCPSPCPIDDTLRNTSRRTAACRHVGHGRSRRHAGALWHSTGDYSSER